MNNEKWYEKERCYTPLALIGLAVVVSVVGGIVVNALSGAAKGAAKAI